MIIFWPNICLMYFNKGQFKNFLNIIIEYQFIKLWNVFSTNWLCGYHLEYKEDILLGK